MLAADSTNVSVAKPLVAAEHAGDSEFIVQREIALAKLAGEPFGLTLAYISKKAIVVGVSGYEGVYATPAIRAGLGFGDEVVSINGLLMSSPTAFFQARQVLQSASVVRLAVREMPYLRLRTLDAFNPTTSASVRMGVTFKEGVVTEVAAESPAAMARIKTGEAIVAINGDLVLGRPDPFLRSTLQAAWAHTQRRGGHLVLTTTPAAVYRELIEAVAQVPPEERSTDCSLHSNIIVTSPPRSPSSPSRCNVSRGSVVAPPTPEATARRRSKPASALSFLRASTLPSSMSGRLHNGSRRTSTLPAGASLIEARASMPSLHTTTPPAASPSPSLRRQTSASAAISSALRRFSSLGTTTSESSAPYTPDNNNNLVEPGSDSESVRSGSSSSSTPRALLRSLKDIIKSPARRSLSDLRATTSSSTLLA